MNWVYLGNSLGIEKMLVMKFKQGFPLLDTSFKLPLKLISQNKNKEKLF